MLRLYLRTYVRRCENLNCYQRIFRVSSKGTTEEPSVVPQCICSRKKPRWYSDVISEGVEGERERFRSFTTFSVFVRLKAKGKGILMRPVLYSSPSLGRSSSERAPETLHGPRSFISNASDTRALFSTCTKRIHQNVRASCTYTRTLISSLHGGQVRVTRTALASFLEDKGVTSLPRKSKFAIIILF